MGLFLYKTRGDEMSDTIAAISTAIGESGIGIVRLTGDGSLEVASKVFKGAKVDDIKE